MIFRSFRTRIMMLSVSVSGLVLLGFGWWAWHVLHGLTGGHRLDSELAILTHMHQSAQGHRAWEDFELALEGATRNDASRRFSFAVVDREGHLIYQSHFWPDGLTPALRAHIDGAEAAMGLRVYTEMDGKAPWRLAVNRNPEHSLVVAADLGPYLAQFDRIRLTFLLVFAVALLCVGGGSWILAWRAIRPLDRLVEATETITAQDLERRLPQGMGGREIDQLVDVFNEMLERLERSFNHATRFSADAAHELKTPLTILQGQLDQALQEAPAGSPLQQNLGRLLEEVQRLKVIIRRLLLLSLADAGRIRISPAPMRLDELVEQIIDDVEILAPELIVTQELEADAWVNADEALLQQAIQNLVNNAIKYNIPGGKIRFQLFRHDGAVRCAIANTSEGIPEEDRQRVFHRFYRVDPAHSRKVDGVGLGLSLAREIMRAHSGKLWLADAPEGWVMFVLELPAWDEKAVDVTAESSAEIKT